MPGSKAIMDADSPMTDSSHSPTSSALLSPPESQPDKTRSRNMPVTGESANANGKRPRKDISNGVDTEDESQNRPLRTATNSSTTGTNPAVKEHTKSGYRWERPEDEPGYAWSNKKALDEHNRALDGLVHRDLVIQGRYGDPLDLADREARRRSEH